MKTIQLSALAASVLAYLAVTFPLAYFWHLVWFDDAYRQIGYVGRAEPLFALGLASMLVQGVLLAVGFRFVAAGKYDVRRASLFCAATGTFFWSTHVLASAAKNAIASLPLFFALETAFVVLQFGCFGVLLGLINRRLP